MTAKPQQHKKSQSKSNWMNWRHQQADLQKLEDLLAFIKDMKKRHEQMKLAANDPEANMVKLMTIHKAKGLEFPIVFFIGASEGIVPHMTAIDIKKYEDQN